MANGAMFTTAELAQKPPFCIARSNENKKALIMAFQEV
jgi:hypothetical protein